MYDVALIKLDEMVDTFTLICLPNINDDFADNKEIRIFGRCNIPGLKNGGSYQLKSWIASRGGLLLFKIGPVIYK